MSWASFFANPSCDIQASHKISTITEHESNKLAGNWTVGDRIRSLARGAFVLNEIGDHTEAQNLFKQVEAMDYEVFAADDPEVAEHKVNMGRAYSDSGNYQRAEEYFKQALQMLHKKEDMQSTYLLDAVKYYKIMLERAGRHRDAVLLGAQTAAESHGENQHNVFRTSVG